LSRLVAGIVEDGRALASGERSLVFLLVEIDEAIAKRKSAAK